MRFVRPLDVCAYGIAGRHYDGSFGCPVLSVLVKEGSTMTVLTLEEVTVRVSNRTVIDKLSWKMEAGKIYSIIGPNGCGKSTLLKTCAGQLKPAEGKVVLQGKPIDSYPRRQLARYMAILQQSQDKIPEITVRTLVSYGRFPHKPLWGANRKEDEELVEWAMSQTGTLPFAERKLSALSGGERQRVWIAMTLAQQTGLILLDEPTTYLDVNHQWEIMELIQNINRNYGVTIVMVLHDLNHAAACSDEVMVMNAGGTYGSGPPEQVITDRMLRDVFGVRASVGRNAQSGRMHCHIEGLLEATDFSAQPTVAAAK